MEEQPGTAIEQEVRRLARDEVASLAGLMLRRLQDVEPESDFEGTTLSTWAEALKDFGQGE